MLSYYYSSFHFLFFAGTYDVHADLTTNTAIASPLLSRFDIVLVLRDTPSKVWDTQVSTFLLKQAVKGVGSGHESSGGNGNGNGTTQHIDATQHIENRSVTENQATSSSNNTNSATTSGVSHWNIKKLRQYIAFVKHSIHPVMSAEARTLLVNCLYLFLLMLVFVVLSAQNNIQVSVIGLIYQLCVYLPYLNYIAFYRCGTTSFSDKVTNDLLPAPLSAC